MSDFFEHGSKWVRADFHLHTAAADEFNQRGILPTTYAEDFVNRLHTRDIRLAIITNHNKFDKQEFLALKASAEQRDIKLLAGVEFSAKDGQRGIHILLVFDDSWYSETTDDINHFLSRAFHLKRDYDRSPYTTNSCYALEELVHELDNFNKDYFLIMAHVDQKNGLFYEVKGRNLEQLLTSSAFKRKVLALQKSTGINNRNLLEQHVGRKLALVEGSDNAEGGMDGIGISSGNNRECYVKLGAFTFEAVKFALIHHQERVSPQLHKPQNLSISSIEIEQGGKETIIIPLNPALNTIIGVRGSGKSTLLETVRYGLGLEPNETPTNYKNEIVRRLMKAGNRLLLRLADGEGKIQYTIQREWAKRPLVLDANGEVLEGLQPQQLLPTAYYGQKDIEELGKNFTASYIEDKLLREYLADKKEKEEALKHEINDIFGQLQKLSDLGSQRDKLIAEIAYFKHNIEQFEQSGLQELVAKELNFADDESKLFQIRDELQEMSQRLLEVIESYGWDAYLAYQVKEAGNILLFENTVFPIIRQLVDESKKLRIQFSEGTDLGTSIIDKWTGVLENFSQLRETLQEEFRRAKQLINDPNLDVESHKQNKQSLAHLTNKLKTIDTKLADAENLRQKLYQGIRKLKEHRLTIFEAINKKIEQLNELKLSFHIKVTHQGDKQSFKDWLSQNSNGLQRENHIKKIVEQYDNPTEIYLDLFNDNSPLATILQGGTLLTKFREVFSNNPAVLTYRVPDKYQFLYNDKPLERYSIGQKATALIAFVLTHEEKKLFIIDQPEDDLDNYTVAGEIIGRIKQLKSDIQFIFATHNPNILVLGDSDQVVICQYHDDEERIEFASGSIDKWDIQQTAVKIMEGGQEAFDRRKDVYQLWTH